MYVQLLWAKIKTHQTFRFDKCLAKGKELIATQICKIFFVKIKKQ